MDLSQDMTPTTISKVYNTLTRLFNQNYIDKDTLANLDTLMDIYTDRQCKLFFIQNTQTAPTGQPFVGRPIISGCSSPTAKISEYIDHFLLPIVTAQPTYVRDTADILRKPEEKTFPPDILITSVDVVYEYPPRGGDSMRMQSPRPNEP